MPDTMLQALIEHFHSNDFKGTEGLSRYVTLVLANGTVVSGAVVSPQHFARMNSEEHGGNCPKDFAFEEASPQSYAHLANAHILAPSGTWVRIGTLRVPNDQVTCCGDISRPSEPPPPPTG